MDARKKCQCEGFTANAECLAKTLMIAKNEQVAAVHAVPT